MRVSRGHFLCTSTAIKIYKRSLTFLKLRNGNNWDCIYDPHQVNSLQTSFAAGHQIASHTWSHPDLKKLSKARGTSLIEVYALLYSVISRVSQVREEFIKINSKDKPTPCSWKYLRTFCFSGVAKDSRNRSLCGKAGKPYHLSAQFPILMPLSHTVTTTVLSGRWRVRWARVVRNQVLRRIRICL